MLTIYKYPLEIATIQPLQVPRDAKILSVQFQNDVLCLWALVDPKKELTIRYFLIFGTGRLIENMPKTVFLATVQHAGYVWHVFEKL